jgi:hypothetical protein
MAKVLLIPYGWLGDRFFTTSVAAVLKRYMPNISIHYLSTPEFSYMDEVLDSFECIDKVVTREEAATIEFDYVFEMPHTDHAENPTKTYCRNILQTDEFDNLDFTPEFVKKEFLVSVTNFVKPFDRYVTFQTDWQNRTRLNVSYILDKLASAGVNCVEIGKHGLSNQGDTDTNKQLFHDALVKIAHADCHLSMLGGTAVMTTYVDTPSFFTMDWHWNKHNDYNFPVEEFMEWWKLIPNSIGCTDKHHAFNPYVTEDEFVDYTLKFLDYDRDN